MRIAYLVHDLADPAVARRVRQLRAGGAEDLRLLGFRRTPEAPAEVAGVPALDLGRTEDARLARRMGSVLAAAARMPRLPGGGGWSRALAGAEVVLARTLEALALAAAARALAAPRARLVYECLDVHRLMLAPGAAGRAMRAVEGALLRRCDRLLVSSPAFVERHFARAYSRPGALPPWSLVENKVQEEELSADVRERGPPSAPPPGPPWRIGWFGVLRCARSLALLADLARRSQGRVEVVLRGRPAPSAVPGFDATVRSTPGLTYGGPYDRARDLEGMYGSIHLAWAMDFYEAGGNSDWLLPNRLYEGGAHGAVPLALASVETGRWLAARGAGILLEEPLERTLGAALLSDTGGGGGGGGGTGPAATGAPALTPERWDVARAASLRLPRADVVADRAEAVRLVRLLAQGV